MRITIVAAILFASIAPATARIGETPTQCIARYGEPISANDTREELRFRKSGFVILARFDAKGVCDLITFYKEADRDGVTPAEFEAFREANGGGEEWTETETREFQTSSGRFAVYLDGTKTAVIATKEGSERYIEDNKKKKSLEGF